MDFTSKFSLYDFLAIFVCGFVWMLVLCPWCVSDLCPPKGDFILSVAYPLLFCVLCYLVGRVMDVLLASFLGWIQSLCESKSSDKKKSKSCCENFCEWVCGLFHSLFRNDKKLIEKAEHTLYWDNVIKHTDECMMRRYYFSYYYLQSKNQLGNIPILEAQEAFLRNLIFPLLVAGPFVIFQRCYDSFLLRIVPESNRLCVGIVLIILAILVFLAHASVQKRVYKLVWEGAHYLSRLSHMGDAIPDPCDCECLHNNTGDQVCPKKNPKQPNSVGSESAEVDQSEKGEA